MKWIGVASKRNILFLSHLFPLSKIFFVLLFAIIGCQKSTSQDLVSPANSSSNAKPQTSGKSDDKNEKQSLHTEIKIASYNINCGNPHLAAMLETIQKAHADVVCLQETTPDSEGLISKSLGKVYPYFQFQGHQGQYGAERFGILSRFPVADYKFIPPKHGLFGFYIADLQLDDRTFQIITVHLQPVLFPNNAGIRDAFAAIGGAEKTHREEIEAVMENVKKGVPTIIAGDFNSMVTFAAPQILLQIGFLDSFAECNKNPESLPTWHWPTRNGELSIRVDYIFHSKDFQATETGVIKSDASDHYLIFSRLKWAGK